MGTEKETGVDRVMEGIKQSPNFTECEERRERHPNDFGKLETIRQKCIFQLAKMILSWNDRK